MQSTRRGSFSVHRSEKTPGSKYSSTSGLSPRGHLERQAEFHASTQDEARLSCPQSAGTLRSESEIRGTLRFLPQLATQCMIATSGGASCWEGVYVSGVAV